MQMCRHRPAAAQRRRLQRQLAVSQPVSPSAREKVRKLGGGCAAKNRKIPGPTTMHHPNCSLLCVCFEKREAISKHTLSCVFILCLSIRYVRAREHFDSSPPGEGRRARPPPPRSWRRRRRRPCSCSAAISCFWAGGSAASCR